MRDKLFSGTALPSNQDRGITFRHPIDERKDLLDRDTLTNHRAQALTVLYNIMQTIYFFCKLIMTDRTMQRDEKRIDHEGLGDEVIRSRTHRRDRKIHAAMSGDHQDRKVRLLGRQLRT